MAVTDPQLTRVYRWEIQQGWDQPQTSFKKCAYAIRSACRHHEVPVPRLYKHTWGLSWSQPEENVISLRRSEWNLPVALHEAAHHIAWHQKGYRIQDHGPYFFSIYLSLLMRARVAPRQHLQQTAREAGIRWHVEAAEA